MSNANRAAALRSGSRVVALRPSAQGEVDQGAERHGRQQCRQRQGDAQREMDEQDGEQLPDHGDPAGQRDRVQHDAARRALAEAGEARRCGAPAAWLPGPGAALPGLDRRFWPRTFLAPRASRAPYTAPGRPAGGVISRRQARQLAAAATTPPSSLRQAAARRLQARLTESSAPRPHAPARTRTGRACPWR